MFCILKRSDDIGDDMYNQRLSSPWPCRGRCATRRRIPVNEVDSDGRGGLVGVRRTSTDPASRETGAIPRTSTAEILFERMLARQRRGCLIDRIYVSSVSVTGRPVRRRPVVALGDYTDGSLRGTRVVTSAKSSRD